jgi:hypothetical protein
VIPDEQTTLDVKDASEFPREHTGTCRLMASTQKCVPACSWGVPGVFLPLPACSRLFPGDLFQFPASSRPVPVNTQDPGGSPGNKGLLSNSDVDIILIHKMTVILAQGLIHKACYNRRVNLSIPGCVTITSHSKYGIPKKAVAQAMSRTRDTLFIYNAHMFLTYYVWNLDFSGANNYLMMSMT